MQKNDTPAGVAIDSAPLLDCPHCGGEAMAFKTTPILPNGQRDTLFHIMCQRRECGAHTLDWYPLTAAVAAWNRRQSNAEAHRTPGAENNQKGQTP